MAIDKTPPAISIPASSPSPNEKGKVVDIREFMQKRFAKSLDTISPDAIDKCTRLLSPIINQIGVELAKENPELAGREFKKNGITVYFNDKVFDPDAVLPEDIYKPSFNIIVEISINSGYPFDPSNGYERGVVNVVIKFERGEDGYYGWIIEAYLVTEDYEVVNLTDEQLLYFANIFAKLLGGK